MNADLKKKWVSMLRSGKYKQGFGWLRCGENEFCANGVYLDVVNPKLWGQNIAKEWHWAENYVFIPTAVSYKEEKVIEDMNDKKRLSFNEIADYIEQNIEED